MYSVLDEAKCMIWKEFTRCDSADSEQRSDTLNIFELQPHGIKQTSHNGTKTKFMNTLKIFPYLKKEFYEINQLHCISSPFYLTVDNQRTTINRTGHGITFREVDNKRCRIATGQRS